MKKSLKSVLCLLTATILLITFSGCGNNTSYAPNSTDIPDATVIEQITGTPIEGTISTVAPAPTDTLTEESDPVSALTDTQRNSINMLNWLAYLTQDINSSSNNRLYIEEVYSLIVNETYPNAVDERTQDRLRKPGKIPIW